jgi:tRNA (guanine9-N1)-methyltransferase
MFATQGLCHRLAIEKGLRHGRLPIGENIDMKTRKVLTIDHGKTTN